MAVCLLVTLFATGNLIARATIAALASSITDTHVSIGDARVGAGGASLSSISVRSLRGEPIATIATLQLGYSIPDFISGRRLYGLTRVNVDRADITIVHHKDGSYNFPLKAQPTSSGPASPIRLGGRFNGTVHLVDRGGAEAASSTVGIAATFAFDTTARSTYDAAIDYVDEGRHYRIRGTGDIDPPHAVLSEHWTVPAMPIAALLNMATPAGIRFSSGSIDGADIRILGLPRHIAVIAGTNLSDLQFAIPGLRAPVRDVAGRLDVSNGAAMFENVRGTLAEVPLYVSGGMYDFSNPRLHLTLAADGDVSQLRLAVSGTEHLPARGHVAIRGLLEGSATAPFAMIAIRAPSLDYAREHIAGGRVLAAFHGHELDVLAASASDRGADADAQGRIALQREPNALEIIAHVRVPERAIPYASTIGATSVDGIALAASSDLRNVNTYGAVAGSSAHRALSGTFDISSNGTGSVGPLVLDGAQGRLFAQAYLDQPGKVDTAFVRTDALWIPALNGSISGNADLIYTNGRAFAQIDDVQASRVAIAGLGIRRASATVAFEPNAVNVLAADIATSSNDVLARGTLKSGLTAISADGLPVFHGSVSIAALARAAIQKPELTSASVVARGIRYNGLSVSGMASPRFTNGRLQLQNTAADVGTAYITVDGSVAGLAFGQPIIPSYDLDVETRAADVSPFVALAAPAQRKRIDASVDASVHVGGSGLDPAIRGSIDVPEGRVNGLAFRDLTGSVSGTRSGISVSNASLVIGTTRVAFDGSADTARDISGRIEAPHADLADFDDLFDAGDMFSGQGRLATTLSYNGGRLVSNGKAQIEDARYRQFNVGNVTAHWNTVHTDDIALDARAIGKRGSFAARGTVDPFARSGNLNATVRQMDLGTWLPLVGFQTPVRGLLDGQIHLTGRFPDVDSSLTANVTNGLIGRVPVPVARIAMQTRGGRGYIESATLHVANLVATGSGAFGLHGDDPLALTIHGTVPDIGAFARTVTGKAFDVAGALRSDARVGGTLAHPQVSDATTLDTLRYQNVTVPRVIADVDVAPASARVHAQATLQHGTLTLQAAAPLNGRFMPRRNARISGALAANRVALSNVASALPKGTKIDGTIDGDVRASGTLARPQLQGALDLANLTYSSDLERTPIVGSGQIVFDGTDVHLRDTSARVGNGTVTFTGGMRLPRLSDPSGATFNFGVVASDATFDAPQYYKGRIDSNLTIVGRAPNTVTLGGTVTPSSARVPLTALYNPKTGGSSAPLPVKIAFNQFRVSAGNDVRVQSSNVDVGGSGSLALNGTLAAPQVSGSFVSTGGTVSFYRTFVVDRARVDFDSSGGIIPRVNATATTYITDPEAMIRIHVTGPATMMNLGLQSDPTYDRAQILGLLAGAQEFGAVEGVNAGHGAPATPTSILSGMAEGQVNEVFTRNLLEPFSSALAGTLGLNDVQLTNVVGQGFGASAGKAFGRNLSGVFSESFGYPKRSSFSLEARPAIATALRATVYTVSGQKLFPLSQPPSSSNLNDEVGLGSLMSMQMESGSNGVDFSYVRKFP